MTVGWITVFREYPDGDIIALFPEEIMDRRGNCVSYQHIGQHAAANPHMVCLDTVSASKDSYAELYQELLEIGYTMDIRPDVTKDMNTNRLTQLRNLELMKYD